MPKISIPPLRFETAEGYAPSEEDCGPFATVALGDLGGLTQFGVRIETLPPGSASSMRHWHSAEDEFVYMLAGNLVLVEDTGETAMAAGASAAFPAGRRNGHCLQNRSRADATFLVAGWRDPEDICTYSSRDRLCVKSGGVARFTRRDGTPIEASAHADPFEDPAPEGPGGAIRPADAPTYAGSSYPAPHADLMRRRSWVALGEAGGLTRFGVNLVTVEPGGLSSLRHWHSDEDELVYLLEGALVLVEDEGETLLTPGDVSAHPAGVANGHHMRNETARPARFLVFGTRAARDTCTYPDVDLINRTEGARSWFTTRGGKPLPSGRIS